MSATGFFVDWDGCTRRVEAPGDNYTCQIVQLPSCRGVNVLDAEGCVCFEAVHYETLADLRATGIDIKLHFQGPGIMSQKPLITITPMAKGAIAERNDIKEILLQRQGVGSTFYGAIRHQDKLVSIETTNIGDSIRVALNMYLDAEPNRVARTARFQSDNFRAAWYETPSQNPLADASARISEELGIPVQISGTRLAYMFDGADRGDIILSPIVYEAATDTIRSAVENYCIVAFEDGKFDSPRFDIDRAAQAYRPFIEQALAKGFGDHELKMGDDYCKRRLAWLAGTFRLEQAFGTEVQVGVLTPTMEWSPTGLQPSAPAQPAKAKGMSM